MLINGRPWSPQSDDAAGGASSRGPHRLEAILKCERKWLLRYGDSQGKGRLLHYTSSENALVGTLLHSRAADFHARQMPTWPKWVTEKTLDERLQDDVRGHPEGSRLVELSRLMWRSVEANTDLAQTPIPYAVEREVWAPLHAIDPHCPPSLRDEIVTARLDLIATQGDGAFKGQLVIWDYKTTGGWGKKDEDAILPKWDARDPRWSMHFQAALALAITRAKFSIPVAGFFIIRVARKAPYPVDRRRLAIPPALLARAGSLATRAVVNEQDVLQRRKAGLPVLPTGAMTDSCGDFGGCEYLSLCQARSPDVERALLASDFFRQK